MRHLGLLLIAGLALFALIPNALLPAPMTYYVDEERTAGKGLVRYAPPGPASVRYAIEFNLTAGTCDVSRLDGEGRTLERLGARVATFQNRLARGESLLITCSEGARGPYHVRIGSALFSLGPMTRSVLLAVAAIGLMLHVVARRLNLKRIALRRRLTFAGTALFSGLVLYSVIHELGHYIFGRAFHGIVREVVWTLFEGDQPHVSFASLPPGATAWMQAGGVFLPTVSGMAGIVLWSLLRRRLSWLGHTLVLTPACVLIAGNLGLLVADDHLGGLMGRAAVTVPLFSIAILALVGVRLWTARLEINTRPL